MLIRASEDSEVQKIQFADPDLRASKMYLRASEMKFRAFEMHIRASMLTSSDVRVADFHQVLII